MLNFLRINKKVIVIALMLFTIALIIIFYRLSPKKNVKPRVGTLVEAIYAIGSVKSDDNYTLRLSTNSIIDKFMFEEGDNVKKGSPLIKIDSGVVFYAPFNGIISKKYFEANEIVPPGQPILTMLDPSKLHLIVSLDQQSAIRVKTGQKAELSFENLRQKKFIGKVERIYPSNSQFYAKIRVKNLPPEILADMTADIAIEVARHDNALMIPSAALNNGQITIIRNGKTKKIRIKPGIINNDWIEADSNIIRTNDDIVIQE
jgi:multidrug efflux pump subunit AcrA (membrane-fusion protein)